MKRNSILLAALLLLGSLSACVSSKTAPQPAAAVVVTDQGGRQVTVPGEVKRIVSGYYVSSSALLALGLKDRIVGIESSAPTRPTFKLAAPGLLRLPAVGTSRELDLEGCLALEPDLVVIPLRLKDSAARLEELGVPVLLVNPESQAALKEMIALLGKACGADERAKKLNGWYDAELAAIEKLVARAGPPPAVYMAGDSSWLLTAPKAMYQSDQMLWAGGKNVAGGIDGDFWKTVSYEQVLSMDPEVIVISSYASYSKKDILTDTSLGQVAAVRNGRVYQMPQDFDGWDAPTPSCILGVRWLLSVLHGDVYSTDDLRRDVSSFYREFYGIENIDTSSLAER